MLIPVQPPPWLKMPPALPPPKPGKADVQAINVEAVELEARGIPSGAATAYIRQNGPQLQIDKWGAPLPLSMPEQDRLNRMVAVLSHPLGRGLALILSGTLDPGEADALHTVYPTVYQELAGRARYDLATTPPPYAIWAEQTLAVLFGRPVAKVYGDHSSPAKGPGLGSGPSKPSAKDESSNPTPADRREVAVRQEKG